ncbi:hypothetical protein CH063_13420, partial [Colletotrichum higginsianum]
KGRTARGDGDPLPAVFFLLRLWWGYPSAFQGPRSVHLFLAAPSPFFPFLLGKGVARFEIRHADHDAISDPRLWGAGELIACIRGQIVWPVSRHRPVFLPQRRAVGEGF